MQRVKDFWLNLSKKKKIIFGLSTFVIVTLIVLASVYYFKKPKSNLVDNGNWEKLVIPDRPSPPFVLTPKETKKFGISAKETFVLVTTSPTTEEIIKKNIVASKPVKIVQISDTEFEITPIAKLDADETITIEINENDKSYNWAFQVAPKLKIVDSLPRDKSNNVPVNAGIEISFNTDDYDDFISQIEVSPKFNFRTEKHDQKLAIIPIDPLNYKSVYEVSVNSMKYSFSFQTGDKENTGRFSLNDDFQQVLPNEPLQSKVNFTVDKMTPIKAEIFKFNNSDDFVNSRKKIDSMTTTWTTYYGEENKLDLSRLSKVSEVTISIQNQDQLNYLQLPFNLDEGLYFIQFGYNNGEKLEHLWVQSTPILGYVSIAKEQSMVWINSINNEAVGESSVSIVGLSETYTTNNEGWTAFTTNQILFDDLKHYIKVATTNGKVIILPVNNLGNQAKPNEKTQSDYWSYLYNERVLYKPNDTVYFWGVAKDKDTGNIPSTVEVGIDDYDGNNKVNLQVAPNSDGSFIGKLGLNNYNTGTYKLKASVSGVEITSSYITVSDFVKPEFKIEVKSDKKAIYSGEKIIFKGQIGFFDGTPASNMPLKIYESSGGENKNLDASKNGEFEYEYQPKYDPSSNYPKYESITVSPQTATQGESEEYGTILVYGSNLKIESTGKQDGSVATVNAKVSNIDLSRINEKGLDNPVSGPTVNQIVKIETTKTWYEKVEKGTYYDFVEKVTKKTYDYVNHSEQGETKELMTDSNGVVNYSLNLDKDRSYNVNLTITDNDGHQSKSQQYFYYYEGQSNNNDVKKAEIVLDKKENNYSIGEEVKVKITKDGDLYKDNENNKFLFVIANRGRQEVYVKENPEMSFGFEEKYKPNIFIGSIIFNGKYYEEVTSSCRDSWSCGGYDFYNQYVFTPVTVVYNKDDSKLKLTITSDKIKYAPGDATKVNVLVTKNNEPVSNASVNLVLVDEALAAMGFVKKPSTLDSLYKHVNSFVYFNYYSHQPIYPDGPTAERGGGGGDRNIFKDTAFFDTAVTNDAGIAEFEFDLPHNVTNWLTYAQSVNSSIDAGIGESSIISTKEFFVTSQFPSVVTVMDNPYLTVNSYGNVLNNNGVVNGETFFRSNGVEISKNNFSITSFKENYVAFPKLEIGKYELVVRGKYQNFEDGVVLPVEVINSRLEFNMFSKLDGVKDITYRTDKPIKLIVTDEGRGKYYYDLTNYCYVSSNRIEKILARVFAKYVLENKFGDKNCTDQGMAYSEFQSADGGIKQVKWGNSDLESTLWATYIDANKFNKDELIKYFESFTTYGDTKNKIMANWGLTILGKPQLNELMILSNSATTFNEKVLVALALNYSGQNEEAKSIYLDLLSAYGYTNKPYLRVQSESQNMDSYLLDTSYLLLLGSKVNNSEFNNGMNLYLRDYRTAVTNVILEVSDITYINNELLKLPSVDTEVSIKSKYIEKTFDLNKGQNVVIDLKSDELESLKVTVNKGKVESLISYFAKNEEFNKLKGDKRLTLNKNVTKIKGDGSGIKLGDILQVTLDYDFDSDAPHGCYDLTDHIPSGLIYIDNPSRYGINVSSNVGYMYDAGSNIVKGCAYNSDWWRNSSNNRSVYYLKVNSVGKYINEPAIIQSNLDPTIFQKTSEEFIDISK